MVAAISEYSKKLLVLLLKFIDGSELEGWQMASLYMAWRPLWFQMNMETNNFCPEVWMDLDTFLFIYCMKHIGDITVQYST